MMKTDGIKLLIPHPHPRFFVHFSFILIFELLLIKRQIFRLYKKNKFTITF